MKKLYKKLLFTVWQLKFSCKKLLFDGVWRRRRRLAAGNHAKNSCLLSGGPDAGAGVGRARQDFSKKLLFSPPDKKIVKTSCLLSGGILPGSGAGPGVNPG